LILHCEAQVQVVRARCRCPQSPSFHAVAVDGEPAAHDHSRLLRVLLDVGCRRAAHLALPPVPVVDVALPLPRAWHSPTLCLWRRHELDALLGLCLLRVAGVVALLPVLLRHALLLG
jgi:hypothetical protein